MKRLMLATITLIGFVLPANAQSLDELAGGCKSLLRSARPIEEQVGIFRGPETATCWAYILTAPDQPKDLWGPLVRPLNCHLRESSFGSSGSLAQRAIIRPYVSCQTSQRGASMPEQSRS